MGANLKVVMLHHIGEDLQNIDLGSELLTLILTSIPQRKIHQQGRGILHGIVRQVILAILEDLDYPGNHAALNHVGLSAFAKTELLERAQGVLAEVRVIVALRVKCLDEHTDNVLVLEEVSPALILVCQAVEEGNQVLLDLQRLRVEEDLEDAALIRSALDLEQVKVDEAG